MPRRYSRLGIEVGKYVGTAEAVNRLLGVADDDQPAGRVAGCIYVLEYLRLQPIGVLELVDQGHRVPGPHPRRQRVAAGAVKGTVQLCQQGIETQAPRGPGAAVQRLSGAHKQAAASTAQPGFAELRCRCAQPFEASEQRDIRRRFFLNSLSASAVGAK